MEPWNWKPNTSGGSGLVNCSLALNVLKQNSFPSFISRIGRAPKGHPDVMAPHHCQALPHTAVRVLKPKHPGGSSRGSADSADYSCITVVHQPDFSTCWFPQQDIVAAIELPCRFLDPEPSSYPCSWANHAPHHSHLSEHLCLNISPWFTRSPF